MSDRRGERDGLSDREDRPGLTAAVQRVLVFQQDGRGENKIRGIRACGEDLFHVEVFSLDHPIPSILDDSSDYLPSDFKADLVLDYLRHPDLSQDLAILCRSRGIPLIASGKRHRVEGTFTPAICCALPGHGCLGHYGERFGSPEFAVETAGEAIRRITVIRGAPCGATGEAAARMTGARVEGAADRMGLEVQFFCTADPSGWDPLYGKSPVHLAAELHRTALSRAMGHRLAHGKCMDGVL